MDLWRIWVMSQILVRGLDSQIVKQLKTRADNHGRSLESEVRLILEQATCFDASEMRKVLRGWQKIFSGRKLADSGKLVSEDRQR
jgi:plasmid stability protein